MSTRIGALLVVLVVALSSCYEGLSKNERYCHALCGWLAECVVTSEPVDYDECYGGCKHSLKEEPLAAVCNDETFDYFICGYEKSLENDCAGDPVDGVVDGCEYAHHTLEECRAQHAPQ